MLNFNGVFLNAIYLLIILLQKSKIIILNVSIIGIHIARISYTDHHIPNPLQRINPPIQNILIL